MSIIGARHRNLASSPEIKTRSPPLFNFSNWFTARLPKPSKSQQPDHLSKPHRNLDFPVDAPGGYEPPTAASEYQKLAAYAKNPRPALARAASSQRGFQRESQSEYVYVNGQGEARRVSYAQLPQQYMARRKSTGLGNDGILREATGHGPYLGS